MTTQKHAYKGYTETCIQGLHMDTYKGKHTYNGLHIKYTYKDRNNSEKNRTVTRINTDRTSETDGEVEY